MRVIAVADSEPQMLSAYGAGADMTLPRGASSTLVSAARRGASARRSWRAEKVVRLGGLEVDRAGRTASVDGQPVRLTASGVWVA